MSSRASSNHEQEEANEESPLIRTDSPTPERMARDQDPHALRYLSYSSLRGISAVAAQLGLLLATTITYRVVKDNPAGLFSYHPSFQILAVLGFVEGILLLQPQPANAASKKKGLQLHQIFQYASLPLIIAGSTFIIYNKAIHGAKHFTSWHAKAGLITLCLIATQITFGALVVYSPLTRLVGGEGQAKKLWKYHRISGYLSLTFLILTPILALWSDWMIMNASQVERNLIGIGFGAAALGAIVRINVSKLGLKR